MITNAYFVEQEISIYRTCSGFLTFSLRDIQQFSLTIVLKFRLNLFTFQGI